MSVVESYLCDIAFSKEQVMWIADHAQYITDLNLSFYRKHYQKHRSKGHGDSNQGQQKETPRWESAR